jgi:hypothetical protein
MKFLKVLRRLDRIKYFRVRGDLDPTKTYRGMIDDKKECRLEARVVDGKTGWEVQTLDKQYVTEEISRGRYNFEIEQLREREALKKKHALYRKIAANILFSENYGEFRERVMRDKQLYGRICKRASKKACEGDQLNTEEIMRKLYFKLDRARLRRNFDFGNFERWYIRNQMIRERNAMLVKRAKERLAYYCAHA